MHLDVCANALDSRSALRYEIQLESFCVPKYFLCEHKDSVRCRTAQRPGFFSVEKAQEIPPFPRISLRKSGPRHLPRLFLSLSQNNCCSTESKATSSRQTTYILCAGGPSSFVSLDLRPPSSLSARRVILARRLIAS